MKMFLILQLVYVLHIHLHKLTHVYMFLHINIYSLFYSQVIFKNLALKQIEASVKQWDGVALAFIKHKKAFDAFWEGQPIASS